MLSDDTLYDVFVRRNFPLKGLKHDRFIDVEVREVKVAPKIEEGFNFSNSQDFSSREDKDPILTRRPSVKMKKSKQNLVFFDVIYN